MQSESPLCQPETLFKILFLLPVSEDFAAMLHELLQEVEGQRAKMAWSLPSGLSRTVPQRLGKRPTNHRSRPFTVSIVRYHHCTSRFQSPFCFFSFVPDTIVVIPLYLLHCSVTLLFYCPPSAIVETVTSMEHLRVSAGHLRSDLQVSYPRLQVTRGKQVCTDAGRGVSDTQVTRQVSATWDRTKRVIIFETFETT